MVAEQCFEPSLIVYLYDALIYSCFLSLTGLPFVSVRVLSVFLAVSFSFAVSGRRARRCFFLGVGVSPPGRCYAVCSTNMPPAPFSHLQASRTLSVACRVIFCNRYLHEGSWHMSLLAPKVLCHFVRLFQQLAPRVSTTFSDGCVLLLKPVPECL